MLRIGSPTRSVRSASQPTNPTSPTTSPRPATSPGTPRSRAGSSPAEDFRRVQLRQVGPREEGVSEQEDFALFDVVVVAQLLREGSGKTTTRVEYQFPTALACGPEEAQLVEKVRQFCFPDADQWMAPSHAASETFSFVLTDAAGERKFGFCRRYVPPDSQVLCECVGLVSRCGSFRLFSHLLDAVEDRRHSKSAVFAFLKAVQAVNAPRPGSRCSIRAMGLGGGWDTITVARPVDAYLEHVDLSLLFTALPLELVVGTVGALLLERKVLLLAATLGALGQAAHGLLALLYPFTWQHVLIPILPRRLLDMVCLPSPYLMGLLAEALPSAQRLPMDDVLIVDLDQGVFVQSAGDEKSLLPSAASTALVNAVARHTIPRFEPTAPAAISRAFLQLHCNLIGHYKKHLLPAPGQRGAEGWRVLDTKAFVAESACPVFLERLVKETTLFDSFIQQREDPQLRALAEKGVFEQFLHTATLTRYPDDLPLDQRMPGVVAGAGDRSGKREQVKSRVRRMFGRDSS